MNTTIFNTPILSQILYLLAVLLMRVFGWRVEGGCRIFPSSTWSARRIPQTGILFFSLGLFSNSRPTYGSWENRNCSAHRLEDSFAGAEAIQWTAPGLRDWWIKWCRPSMNHSSFT